LSELCPSLQGVLKGADMLLSGKNLLVTGVLTPQSIAYGIAELAQQQGARVLLTGFGRGMSLTQRSAKRLSPSPEVLELDVTNVEHFRTLTHSVKERFGVVHGVLHAVAFAPEDALGGNFLNTPWESVQTAFRVSTFSLKELAVSMMPLMTEGGSILTLDFDNRVAWPVYDWMGVCKAGLEATVRYLARDLGPKNIRVNALAAGPLSTMAARIWGIQAPLGWSARQHHGAVAKGAVALLSDWFPATTGEMVHVDGGYHAVGAAPIDIEADLRAREAADAAAAAQGHTDES
jgi:enoyl ACP reductase